MLKIVCLLVGVSQAEVFDSKIITNVRHGLEKNLDYIDQNYERVNVDCLFGVVLSTAIIADAYQNGTHIMDISSLKIIGKTLDILRKSMPLIDREKFWIARYILDHKIWYKNIKYKHDELYPFSKLPNFEILENLFKYQDVSASCLPDTDYCLQDVINSTLSLEPHECFINEFCRRRYYGYDRWATGYTLTHKLLLLQLANARKCQMNDDKYKRKTRQLCSLIFAEVFNGDYFNQLDYMFDLFLEEILLCGYEGFDEFFNYKWLYYILKSQRSTGCFSAILNDSLKTRMKKASNIFEDGCADHTTGLASAVLALHYNYIIKENIAFVK